MGDNILGNPFSPDNFTIKIGEHIVPKVAKDLDVIKQEMLELTSINSVKFDENVWKIDFKGSQCFSEEQVRRIKEHIINDNLSNIKLLLNKKPLRLPRKFKKALKNGKCWAVNLYKKRYPTFNLKNCSIVPNIDNDLYNQLYSLKFDEIYED